MLSLQSIQVRVGGKVLLDQASFSLHPQQKVGLIGTNGAGKSSLFNAILQQLPLDAGQIEWPNNWLIGSVAQEIPNLTLSALDWVLTGDSLYQAARQAIDEAELSGEHEALVQAYDQLDLIAGYEVPQKAKLMLFGLGFTEADFSKPVKDFSGGWQVRLKLATALMQRSDLLLLDEPTNHLDIEAVSWLIQWLKGYEGAVMVISHDRHFLDEVVGGIVQLADQRLTYYAGNFAAFERQRHEQLMQQQALHDKQKQQMQHLKTFIARFKAKASKAKQAQSRVKALQRMEEVAAVAAVNPFQFRFSEPDHLPDPMLQFNELDFAYLADQWVLQSVTGAVRAGDRIGLVGINGSGKSTLLKLLVGDLTPQSGRVKPAKGCQIGYFAQHQLESLDLEASPVQHLLRLSDEVTDQSARTFLGQFGFNQEQALQAVKVFSGGEKARLALALILHQKPNLLILDEPTNHLDMETRDALDMALQDYSGAVILVSHDQHLLSSIVDQFWWVHDRQVEHFYGSLEDYLQVRLKQLKAQQKQVQADKVNLARPSQSDDATKSKKTQRQANAQVRKQIQAATRVPAQALKKVEQKLSQAQQALQAIHLQMEDSELYEASQSARLTDILKTEAQLKTELEALEMQWLELEEEIEAIKAQFE